MTFAKLPVLLCAPIALGIMGRFPWHCGLRKKQKTTDVRPEPRRKSRRRPPRRPRPVSSLRPFLLRLRSGLRPPSGFPGRIPSPLPPRPPLHPQPTPLPRRPLPFPPPQSLGKRRRPPLRSPQPPLPLPRLLPRLPQSLRERLRSPHRCLLPFPPPQSRRQRPPRRSVLPFPPPPSPLRLRKSLVPF